MTALIPYITKELDVPMLRQSDDVGSLEGVVENRDGAGFLR